MRMFTMKTAGMVAVAAALAVGVMAEVDPTLPQNFRMSNLARDTQRGHVTFTIQWEQAKQAGTGTPYLSYQLPSHCSYTVSSTDKLSSGSGHSGLMEVHRPSQYRALPQGAGRRSRR